MWPLLLLLFTVDASSILSTTPLTFVQDGQLLSKQLVRIQCTDQNPFEFEITRTDKTETDTVTVQCHRPEIRYNQRLHSYVPWSVQYKVPILEVPAGTNFTNGSAFEIKAWNDKLSNSDTTKTSTPIVPNILQSLKDTREKIQFKLNKLYRLKALLQGNTEGDDANQPQPPPPPGSNCVDPKDKACIPTNPDGSSDIDAFRDKLNGLTSWEQISRIEFVEDLMQGLGSTISTGILARNLFTLTKQLNVDGLLNPATDATLGTAAEGALMGSAVAIEFIAPLVISSLAFGGTSPLGYVMKDISILIGALLDIDRTIEKYEKDQQNYDLTQNQIDRDYDLEIGYINNRLSEDEENIAILSNQTQILQRELLRVVDNVDGRFNQLAGTLSTFINADKNITNYLNDMDQRDIRRFKSVYNTIQKLVLAIEANSDAIEAVRTVKSTRRLAAAYYHDLIRKMQTNPPEAGPVLPFVDDIGTPPMSYNDIQLLRTKDNAVLMSEVLLQGTFYTNAGYFASETSIAILCDPTRIANFSTAINFDFILRLIGPSTPNAPACFDTGNAWFCDCVFRVNQTNVHYDGVLSPPQAPNNPLFPFEFTNAGTPMRLDPQTYRVFPQCTQQTLVAKTCAGETNPLSFFATLEEFETRLGQLCQFQWTGGKLRVITPRLGRFSDISVVASAYPDGYVCETDYYNITGPDFPNNNTVPFAVFRGLSLDFTAYFTRTQYVTEKRLYGVAGQADMRQYLGSRYPSFTNAYKSYELDLLGLVTRQDSPIVRAVPVYELVKASEVYQLTFSINDQDDIVANLSAPTSVKANSSVGNVTVAIGNTLSSLKGANLLDDIMLWMGPETTYTSDLRTHDSSGNPLVHYDFKRNSLLYNTGAKQREGALNYLEYRIDSFNPNVYFGEGMPFNQSVWAGIESTLFDPYSVDSPLNYMRYVDPDTGLCTDWMDSRYMARRTFYGPLPNLMCQIRDNFFLNTPLTPDQSTASFLSREFAYEVEITVPSGAISMQINTQCPDSVTIARYADVSIVTVVGTGSSLKYSICSLTNCIVSGDILSLPLASEFREMNQEYFFQAWPRTADNPTAATRCFYQNEGRGVSLFFNKTYNTDNGLPDNIYQSTMQIVSADKTQTNQMLNIILDIVNAIATARVDLTTNQLVLNVDTNVSYLHDNPDLDDQIDEFNNNVERIKNNSLVVAEIAKNMTLVLTLLTNLTNQQTLNALQTQADIDALDAKIKLLQTGLDNLGQPGVGGSISFGFLDNFFHGIEKLLGLPFGLLGSLSGIMNILMWFLVIGLIVCLCCGVLQVSKGGGMGGVVQSVIPVPMGPRNPYMT